MRILIIEDEIKTALYLQKGLIQSGYTVDIANNGTDGLHFATQHHYDLIILDVMLPQLNGWSIITKIQHCSPETRVLFLTACYDLEDKIKGLELGADDYITKPFSFSELLARVRSSLRRGTVLTQNTLILDDLKMDFIKHKVTRGSNTIHLTPKEFNLLAYLANHQGEVVSRTQIAEHVWDINFDSDTNVIDVAIRRLRSKIDTPFSKKLIHTVHGIGYVFELR